MKSATRLAAVLLTSIVAAPAFAGYTAMKAAPKAEASTADVLAHLYGGTFVGDDLSLANGSVVATRLEDQTDQIWSGPSFTATAVGRFSGNTQGFGYFDQANTYQPLFETTGDGFEVSGSAVFMPKADSFAWGRRGDSGTQSSEDFANADHRDHMVTYEIRQSAAAPMWLLFWEDLNDTQGYDSGHSASDFNDLVVALRTGATPRPVGPVAVPLPPAALPGLVTAGLGALVVVRRKWAKH